MSSLLANNFFKGSYEHRFFLAFILLVIVQSVLVLLPSGMCQTVEAVPPSGLQIQLIIPGNTQANLFWDLGNAGGSTFTGLYYSTDGGNTWALIIGYPPQTGSASLAATSAGVALVNDDVPYTFILAVSTEAFPDYLVNIPSPAVSVTPSASPPVRTAPQISTISVVGLTFPITINLGSPGISAFNKVYYSTNNGTDWIDTELDLSNALVPGGTLDYTITLASDTDAILLSDTQYQVVFATTTFASSTKLPSITSSPTTQNISLLADKVQPYAPTGVYTNSEDDYVDLYFQPPQNLGTGTVLGYFYTINNGISYISADFPVTRIDGVGSVYAINGLVGVITSDFPDPKDIVNTASFIAVKGGVGTAPADAPTIDSITPGNASLRVTWHPNNPGSGTFQALYYQVDTGDFVLADVNEFKAGSFDITTTNGTTLLVNGTPYDITLRITNSDYLNVDDALDSNTISNIVPTASPVRPDVPVIDRIFTGPNDENAQFTFNFTLGSSGSAPFTNVYYTTTGSAPYVALPNNPTASGYVTITETSGGTPLLLNTTYIVKIVSITDDFDETTNTNVSAAYSMAYTGAVVAPSAPILNSVTQVVGEDSVSLDFTLVNFGSSLECQLWFSSDGGTNYREIPQPLGYNASSPLVVSSDSSSGVFVNGTYLFQLALTNAFSNVVASAPQSNQIPLEFVPVSALARNALRNSRDIGKTGGFAVLANTLGNEVCTHENWKGFQSSSKDVVAGLALALPTVILWKRKVAPTKPLMLALFFWISYHAIRDIRDKRVTTEYKIATRLEFFLEHLLFWLYYGCLISAAFSLIRV
jgi:hypothetical protein